MTTISVIAHILQVIVKTVFPQLRIFIAVCLSAKCSYYALSCYNYCVLFLDCFPRILLHVQYVARRPTENLAKNLTTFGNVNPHHSRSLTGGRIKAKPNTKKPFSRNLNIDEYF